MGLFDTGRWFPGIVSGGQTGADRAALDFAVENNLSFFGWVPLGGWAEDMTEPPGLLAVYPNLQETPSPDTTVRTRMNILKADAALTVYANEDWTVSDGTNVALRTIEASRKPSLIVCLDDPSAVTRAAKFLSRLGPTKHVAIGGPRESESPGIYDDTMAFLALCWSLVPA